MRGEKAAGICVAATCHVAPPTNLKTAHKQRFGRKAGAGERRTKKWNRRKALGGPQPPVPGAEELRTVQEPSRQQHGAAHNTTGSITEVAGPAAEAVDLRAEVSQLSEQLSAARREIEAAHAHVQDYKQSSHAVQLQAYNDGFTAGMMVAMESAAAVAWAVVAALNEKVAALQAQLTDLRAEASDQSAEQPAQVTEARTAAADSTVEQPAQLKGARMAASGIAAVQSAQLKEAREAAADNVAEQPAQPPVVHRAVAAEQVAELKALLSSERAALDVERDRNHSFRYLHEDTLRLIQKTGRMKLYRQVEKLREEYGLDDDSDGNESYEDSDTDTS